MAQATTIYSGKNFIIVELGLFENTYYGVYNTSHNASTDVDKLMARNGKSRDNYQIVELKSV